MYTQWVTNTRKNIKQITFFFFMAKAKEYLDTLSLWDIYQIANLPGAGGPKHIIWHHKDLRKYECSLKRKVILIVKKIILFLGTVRWCAGYWGKSHQYFYQYYQMLWTAIMTSNNKICPFVKQWRECYGGSKLLSAGIWGLVLKRKHLAASINLTKNSQLRCL